MAGLHATSSQTFDRVAPRVPPQNLDAERAVLGCVLIDNHAINAVQENLDSEDFYHEGHRIIFDAMVALSDKSEPTDFLTVHNHLEKSGKIELAGGSSYLSSLTDAIPSAANVESYAKIVKEKSMTRRLIQTAQTIIEDAYRADGTGAEEMLDEAEKKIFQVSENKKRPSFADVKDVVKDSFKGIEKLAEQQKQITGLATGINDFDEMTCGLQSNDLIIIAARPSMGKTTLVLNFAEYCSIHEKASVAIFSLEMAKEQLVTRMLCSQAKIDATKLRKGQLDQSDWPKLTKAAGMLSEAKIYIDDTGSPTVMEMRAKARRLAKEKGLDLIIIDYMQLIRGSASTQKNREQEISEISRSLKGLAKELSVPVIALSQLNRAVESRTNRRPQMSDLRESGAIEQDADLIGFIYRDEVYDPNTPDKGVAELIIGKQRNGPIGTVRMAFINTCTRFENLAFDYEGGFDPGQDDTTPF